MHRIIDCRITDPERPVAVTQGVMREAGSSSAGNYVANAVRVAWGYDSVQED